MEDERRAEEEINRNMRRGLGIEEERHGGTVVRKGLRQTRLE